MKNEEIKNKVLQLCLENGKFPSSKNQKYLNELLNGELNKFISNCICDIVLEDKKLVIEYDGGGHWLGITLGDINLNEFNLKEINREKRIINKGYKIIRIISRKDLLIEENELKKLIGDLIEDIKNFNIIKLDIDNKNIIYDNGNEILIKEIELNIIKNNFIKIRGENNE